MDSEQLICYCVKDVQLSSFFILKKDISRFRKIPKYKDSLTVRIICVLSKKLCSKIQFLCQDVY